MTYANISNDSSSWSIIDSAPIKKDGKIYVLCRCRCGKEKEVIKKNVISGTSKSCGCVGRNKIAERTRTHGKRFTRTWRIWQAMKNRCYNKNVPQYKNYGGRGIKVCEQWKKDFASFYAHVGDIPEGMSIDRIDNNGDYTPANVKLSTAKEQCQNKTNNRKIDGVCISEISKSLGGGHSLVAKRLERGWDIERAIKQETNAVR